VEFTSALCCTSMYVCEYSTTPLRSELGATKPISAVPVRTAAKTSAAVASGVMAAATSAFRANSFEISATTPDTVLVGAITESPALASPVIIHIICIAMNKSAAVDSLMLSTAA
jgi:hypothetical protein